MEHTKQDNPLFAQREREDPKQKDKHKEAGEMILKDAWGAERERAGNNQPTELDWQKWKSQMEPPVKEDHVILMEPEVSQKVSKEQNPVFHDQKKGGGKAANTKLDMLETKGHHVFRVSTTWMGTSQLKSNWRKWQGGRTQMSCSWKTSIGESLEDPFHHHHDRSVG
jgi:hypothetical protein